MRTRALAVVCASVLAFIALLLAFRGARDAQHQAERRLADNARLVEQLAERDQSIGQLQLQVRALTQALHGKGITSLNVPLVTVSPTPRPPIVLTVPSPSPSPSPSRVVRTVHPTPTPGTSTSSSPAERSFPSRQPPSSSPPGPVPSPVPCVLLPTC